MSFFSIIIPTFNSEKTLERCLKSVVNQSFKDFEILIMDGLSTDSTLAIVKSFNDDRIKIFSEKDKGIYDAMNKGIDKANGKWLYFLGSDDELYDEKVLEKIYFVIQTTRKKIIYGNVKIIGNAGWAKDGDIYDGEFNLEKILRKNICHQAVFYHKSVYTKLGYYNMSYILCADWDFNLRCFAKYCFSYTDIIIAKFSGGNTSAAMVDNMFGKEKWKNISQYFKCILYKKVFTPYLIYLDNKVLIVDLQIKINKFLAKLRNVRKGFL